ncbi:hypothetical protein GTW37_02575 [Streptomyces sp. SID4931]|nr:hypothetical protein [Streptomyces sp. SID4931]SCF64844.1 hypothetical protein GA0115255_101323 [Streptomyces sp. Ncost-T6T-2b]
MAQRFHYDVDRLERGRGEIVGLRADRDVTADYVSNHLSGTALALYPENYPLGVTGNFFPHQVTAIRDILAELEGVVKWGGDMSPASEATFFIDVPPGSRKLEQVAAKLREWQVTPGKGAGTAERPGPPAPEGIEGAGQGSEGLGDPLRSRATSRPRPDNR